ncbi:MAG: NAD(P)/FAD-dependent oxidoreductase [Metamycoplasmataceae bacterium]
MNNVHNELDYDVIIIGAGPAGLNAALYLSRSKKKTLFIEKGAPGGKMVQTFKIDNWIGTKEINGATLSLNMFNHAKEFGAVYKYGEVKKIHNKEDYFKIIELQNGEKITTKVVIIASGMTNRVPREIDGIEEYENKGVSYCVICDGPFYEGKPQGIIGGGNSAIEEASFLSTVASKVYIFVKDEKIIAEKIILDQALSKKNIEIILNSQIKKINGNNEGIESVDVNVAGEDKNFKINALFPYIGFLPLNSFASHIKIFDEKGFIKTNENMETEIKGIFAIGDIRSKEVRQIITAASDGAIAAKYITNLI